jgi:hypothetical protein
MAKLRTKDLLFQVRYPYTAGMIAIIWLGSAVLVAIDHSLPLSELVVFNSAASVIVALLGFPSLKR